MKSLLIALITTASFSSAWACGPSGVTLNLNDKAVGYIDIYGGTVSLEEGWELSFLNSKGSAEDGGIDALDVPGQWKWICDERSGIREDYRKERPYCHELTKDQASVYVLPQSHYGLRDFHIGVNLKDNKVSASAPLVFKAEKVRIDPNQPRPRGGGCGTSIEPM